MRATRTSLAAIFAAMAVVAFESDADAQARRGESRQATSTSHSTSRSSNVTKTTPRSSKPSGTRVSPSVQTRKEQNPAVQKNDRKPSTTVTRPAGDRQSQQMRPSSSAKPSQQAKPSHPAKPSIPAKPSGKFEKRDDKPIAVTRPGNRTDRPAGRVDRPQTRPDRPSHKPERPVQVRADRKPDVHRPHPRKRDFIIYDRPSHFWTSQNHWYGHRVKILPSHVRRHIYHGITYYCYNDIWYRPYGSHYVVCRPPFGTVLAANLIADMTWAAVRLSYYNTVANTYSRISENNAYIAQQNEIIARNNATIAAQNQTIAMNQQLAAQAYGLADQLGLVQSYAAAGSTYYYQDGVFYAMDSDGQYKVIVPPAGALVETLPEDYDMVTLGGEEYYKVDDTVYRVTISEGKPFFEVLGQLYV